MKLNLTTTSILKRMVGVSMPQTTTLSFDEEDTIAAMNAICGFSRSVQVIEKRRCKCDGLVDRTFKEVFEYWLIYYLTMQDMMQAWELFPVFVLEPIAKAACVQSEFPVQQGTPA